MYMVCGTPILNLHRLSSLPKTSGPLDSRELSLSISAELNNNITMATVLKNTLNSSDESSPLIYKVVLCCRNTSGDERVDMPGIFEKALSVWLGSSNFKFLAVWWGASHKQLLTQGRAWQLGLAI